MALVDQTPPGRKLFAAGGGLAAGGAFPAAGAVLKQAGRGKLPLPVVIYLLSVVFTVGFTIGPLYMTTMRVLLLVMIVPLMIQLLSGRFGRVLPVDILFFLHICWALVAVSVMNPSQVFLHIGSNAVEFLGGYVLARAYIRSVDDVIALCRMVIVLALCLLPFAIKETLDGRAVIPEFIRSIPGLHSVVSIYYEKRMGLERVQASFAHPIHYGLFGSIAFSMAFVAMKDVYSTATRWGISALLAICTLLSLSSGALLALVLQLGLIFWAWALRRYDRRWWYLVGLFALAYAVIDLLSNRDPMAVFMSYATFSAHNAYMRAAIFEYGMDNVWLNPYFGIGLGDNWVRPSWMHSSSVDNFWLVMALRYGIPGFLLIASGYLIGMVQVARRNFGGDAVLGRMRQFWMFTMLGICFTLTTVHIWSALYSLVFFVFGAGMWLISATPAAAGAEVPDGEADPRAGRRLLLARSFAALGPHLRPAASAAPARGPLPLTRSSPDAPPGETRPGPADGPSRQEMRYTRFPPATPQAGERSGGTS